MQSLWVLIQDKWSTLLCRASSILAILIKMNTTHKDNSKHKLTKKYMTKIKKHGKGKALKSLSNHKVRVSDVSEYSNYKKLVDYKWLLE